MHDEAIAASLGPLTTLADKVSELGNELIASLPRLAAALVAVLVTFFAAKLTARSVKRLLERADKRPSLVGLARQLSYIAVWLVGITVAATIAFPSLTPGQLVGVVGLGSVAIGFAFKDIFENFFAGILILWRFPFEMGDVIECNGITGRVEDVTIRMTLIRALDGELLLVPNSILFKNAVTVLTAEPVRRARVVCGVAYDTDLATAQRVIHGAVSQCASVEGERPLQVFAEALADSSINFDIRWWTSSQPAEFRESQSEVIMAIKSALDEAGIEIPFPQRTLTFPEPLSLRSKTERPREASAQAN
ncbi:MAG: mechanosensitive ion channel family protein [Myxococcales bacterium]|nr:mechanosensitive ion channel family protein [Myxococcales bacterium]MCB9575494.1 mechanosensitive ion channel family protein [Polyangiaceae bacterium]